MPEFRPGELVRATITGRISRVDGTQIHITYESPDDLGIGSTTGRKVHGFSLVTVGDGVSVQRIAPPEWPPQEGDLWRDGQGCTWFAMNPHRILRSGIIRDMVPERALAEYGPMTLVRREGEGDNDA